MRRLKNLYLIVGTTGVEDVVMSRGFARAVCTSREKVITIPLSETINQQVQITAQRLAQRREAQLDAQ